MSANLNGIAADDLCRLFKERFEISGKHKHYKTVSQQLAMDRDMINLIFDWMKKYRVKIEFAV